MEVINLEKYPLDKGKESKEYKKCVSDLKSRLVHDGVATCPNFLKELSYLTMKHIYIVFSFLEKYSY